MFAESTALCRVRRVQALLLGSLVGVALASLGCGSSATEPVSVPQAPPAPVEPRITGKFVDGEHEGSSPGTAAAEARMDASAPSTDPARSSVLAPAPDAAQP